MHGKLERVKNPCYERNENLILIFSEEKKNKDSNWQYFLTFLTILGYEILIFNFVTYIKICDEKLIFETVF